jgi:hypothetical protein
MSPGRYRKQEGKMVSKIPKSGFSAAYREASEITKEG